MKIIIPILMVGVLAIVLILGFVITSNFNRQVQAPQGMPKTGETTGGQKSGISDVIGCAEIGMSTGTVSSVDVSYTIPGEETVRIRARDLRSESTDFRIDITGTDEGKVIYNSQESVAYVYEVDKDVWREFPKAIASQIICRNQGPLINSTQG